MYVTTPTVGGGDARPECPESATTRSAAGVGADRLRIGAEQTFLRLRGHVRDPSRRTGPALGRGVRPGRARGITECSALDHPPRPPLSAGPTNQLRSLRRPGARLAHRDLPT